MYYVWFVCLIDVAMVGNVAWTTSQWQPHELEDLEIWVDSLQIKQNEISLPANSHVQCA